MKFALVPSAGQCSTETVFRTPEYGPIVFASIQGGQLLPTRCRVLNAVTESSTESPGH